MQKRASGGAVVTVWLDDDLAKRVKRLARRMNKKTDMEVNALIWWLISRGCTVEEDWQDQLEKWEQEKRGQ